MNLLGMFLNCLDGINVCIDKEVVKEKDILKAMHRISEAKKGICKLQEINGNKKDHSASLTDKG
jgi:hypothetical protein